MSRYIKFKSVNWISFAIPGTVIEIRVIIVRNDISFKRPQRYYMKSAKPVLRIMPPANEETEIKFIPSLNFEANSAAATNIITKSYLQKLLEEE